VRGDSKNRVFIELEVGIEREKRKVKPNAESVPSSYPSIAE
jgi:hypothetical protein